MKKCVTCNIEKPIEEYHKSMIKISWYRCKSCHSQISSKYNNKEKQKQYYQENKNQIVTRVKQRREDNPEVIKNAWLKKNYKITLDDYNQMLFNQKGCCAICNTHHTELSRALAVDHCHTTGKVRGLLCNNCNTALGKFKDNITLLKQSIKYLKLWDSSSAMSNQ